MRVLGLVVLVVGWGATSLAHAQAAGPTTDATTTEALDEAVPEAPSGRTDLDDESAPPEVPQLPSPEAEVELGARTLADPLGLSLRAAELDTLLETDARSARDARTLGAVMGYVIGAIGLGATPLFFAFDDGSGLLPILSILPLQLGALSLATAILGSLSPSTEERRFADWQSISAGGRPGLAEIARFEGFLVADADRARDARLFSIAQGISGLATGLFTGVVGLAASHVELTQITLGALGAAEILLGALQLVGSIEPGEVERRPGQYEARTGVRLSLRATGLGGTF
ncbi:MAG: hypothetical protein K1X94_05135 [Sandaracinaceae bacterium]|nr:hypothetical protein [Sandaracinaceae bacterium]